MDCIFCGTPAAARDGAHIYPRKYMALTAEPDNIIPLCRRHHTNLDKISNMDDRISHIDVHMSFTWRGRYYRQLARLNVLISIIQSETGRSIRWA